MRTRQTQAPGRRDLLAARRKLVGLSQEALAAQLEIDRTTVTRWERGAVTPTLWIRPKLAEALRVSPADLSDLLDEPARRLSLAHAVPAVEPIQAQVDAIEARYDTEASSLLLADAASMLARITAAREAGTDASAIDPVEAKAAILMGKVVWDAAQRRESRPARQYFNRAGAAAFRAGDPVTQASALLRNCYLSLYGDKDPAAALPLAQQSTELADRSSNVLAGLGLLHAAESFAMLGDRRETERALAAAESRLARAASDDPASDWFSPATFDRLAGSCYLSLGDGSRAQMILEDARTQIDAGSKSESIVTGNIALALIRQGLPDEAATVLHDAINLVEANRGGGGLSIVFQAGHELRPWRRVNEVEDVRERLYTLISS
jgi:transcriptional regulator with XRE-family HTH domain